jgi:hypothetical protein
MSAERTNISVARQVRVGRARLVRDAVDVGADEADEPDLADRLELLVVGARGERRVGVQPAALRAAHGLGLERHHRRLLGNGVALHDLLLRGGRRRGRRDGGDDDRVAAVVDPRDPVPGARLVALEVAVPEAAELPATLADVGDEPLQRRALGAFGPVAAKPSTSIAMTAAFGFV